VIGANRTRESSECAEQAVYSTGCAHRTVVCGHRTDGVHRSGGLAPSVHTPLPFYRHANSHLTTQTCKKAKPALSKRLTCFLKPALLNSNRSHVDHKGQSLTKLNRITPMRCYVVMNTGQK
jgi:hypothetical protein